ncbi:insulin-like growth factor-binding protein 3 precursor [Danio rerio]|uniref:Insulin-like growth factor-binding protein 3 n=1 Tax=Danio rerio TaxID=7955 RepID=Q66I28_DANRE|nr:insulin-like growth factor-binding protein 3 precursor [Danio rerio]AAH81574.1 Insulin-like growth factor binding protein 3 [Danio rerio]|eukprot:NP_991314.2 insulin-like growth factor-binding protein 3 precursor [Danio rerio]
MTGLCALCLTALLAAFARLAESVSPVVRCEPCDDGAMVLCKPLPWDCDEPVKEPGCGCCLTCPLTEGQACGVYTGRCGTGLSCQHRPGESKPLQALLEGRGVCAKAPDKKQSGSPSHGHDKPETEGKEQNGTRTAGTGEAETVHHTTDISRDVQGGSRTPSEPSDPMMHSNKLEMIQKEQVKKSQVHKVVPFSGWIVQDIHNFSLESKRENEYGPCRREMESVMKQLKFTNVLNPRRFRIPNCDQKGFYKKKQCSPSKGRKRGHCWCVDKYGQPLPGYDGKEKVHCYNMETK